MSEDSTLIHLDFGGVPADPIAIPYQELSAEALQGVVKAFVLREGTDYGEREVTLETKVAQVMRQLERGEAQIWFDPDTSSVDLRVRVPTPR